MPAVRLMGGLGNQLFQYGFGRALAVRLGEPLRLDLRGYETTNPGETPRSYELGIYPIHTTIADPGELPAWPRSTKDRLLAKVGLGKPLVEGTSPGWCPIRTKRNALYVGYWQSERWFAEIAGELRADLKPREPASGANADYLKKIGDGESVSVHVRRGDYANAYNVGVHGLAPLEYYRAALAAIRERIKTPRFFVFSDDLPWCREHLPLDGADFVEGNGGSLAYEDLRLMAACRHHIVANSSFSWWGAWLNPHPTKIVVAPSEWFADPKMDETGIVPEAWIRV